MKTDPRDFFADMGSNALKAALAISPLVASQIVIQKLFNKRIQTYQPLWYQVSDFDGLERKKHVFTSNKGQKLTGYLYSSRLSKKQVGIVIVAHGFGGGGQTTYMDCINYLCAHEFYVFAYDATGNDESEGNGIIGFPQGVIDLHYAINYVHKLKEYNDLPIMLFGHSWGAYSVSNVLYYHPEVKAVVALSGFNQSTGLFQAQANRYMPGSEGGLIPYLEDYEKQHFDKLANTTAMRAFAKSQSAVYVIHSKDDNVVPFEAGFQMYFDEYKGDPRFKFESYNYRGHGTIYYTEQGKEYTEKFDKEWKSFLRNKPNEQQKIEYINNNLNREIWNNRLDQNLFSRIVDFYKQNI